MITVDGFTKRRLLSPGHHKLVETKPNIFDIVYVEDVFEDIIEAPVVPVSVAEPKEKKEGSISEIAQNYRSNTATKRILYDLKEMHDNPSTTITAAPFENDIFHWHANIVGPSESLYAGWSSAYSIQSILIQLQSLLTIEPEISISTKAISKPSPKCDCNCPPIDPKAIQQINEEQRSWKLKYDAKVLSLCNQIRQRLQLPPKEEITIQHFLRYRDLTFYRKRRLKIQRQQANDVVRQRKIGKFFGVLKKYEELTEEEIQFKRQMKLKFIVIPKIFKTYSTKNSLLFEKIAQNCLFEFKIRFKPQDAKSEDNNWYITRRFQGDKDQIHFHRTEEGIVLRVEINESLSSEKPHIVQQWEEIYPHVDFDPATLAKQKAGIPLINDKQTELIKNKLILPNIQDEVSIQILNIPFLGNCANSKNKIKSQRKGEVKLRLAYDITDLSVKESKWKMVSPDDKRKGNFFAMDLITNKYNLTYIDSLYYFFRMSDKEVEDLGVLEEKNKIQEKFKAETNSTLCGLLSVLFVSALNFS